ncbi:hypothetical protein RVR_P1104 (plasmid) [Actinacidiphila reveromycinica]|uniref:Uncharacterized protein n=1 Tax=Actinacidiphila reveromycinica TaxID=659352 RepID=A0A7R6QEC4_9ACTN|nr:hypothetical protein [Streptomyces sp. SN-593]BBG20721.1 hypothetical protein RVR_P1104 [Streptomyces sp. SN-593]
MSNSALPARFSPAAASYFAALEPSVQELLRDVLDIASRAPMHWPAWDAADPEGADLRSATVGALTVIYWINRMDPVHLYVMDIVWLG